MRWLRETFHRNIVERELDDEVRYHIERETQANVNKGMSPEAATRKARLDFGGVESVKEDCRDQRRTRFTEQFLQDVHYGLHTLRKTPGFTAVAIITLALGIGANTAIFSLVYAMLLKPLPYAQADRVITFRGNHSLPDAMDINARSRTLQDVGVFADFPLDFLAGSQPEQVYGAIVGGDVFHALGTNAAKGRYLTQRDNDDHQPVAVISDNFWHQFLAADPNVLGRKLTFSGNIYTVVGVMPAGFRLPLGRSELWLPFTVGYPEAVNARGAHFTFPVARLRDGVTLAQAQSELNVIGAELGREHPDEARTFTAMPIRQRMTTTMRAPLLILFGAVSFVLLIACVNFSSLLMTRTASRAQEFQVRMALGAGRWRVLRQIVTESVVIAFFGAVAGILLAELASRLLLTLKPEDLRDLNAPVLNTTSLLFAIAISVLCGIVFGLAPASQLLAGRTNIHSSSRSNTTRTRLRSGMVIAECAMALILLTGAGLLLRSFWKLLSVDSGFDANQLLTLRLNLPATRYKEIPIQVDFLRRLDGELAQVPGVESAGLVSELPMAGMHMEHNLLIKGRPEPETGKEPEISAHEAGPSYFQTMRIPLLSGRAFTLQDTSISERVAVISRSMAEQYWPDQSPIGSQIRWARADKVEWMTIVGVVGDIRHDGLDDAAYPAVYTPYTQKQMPWKRFVSVVVRTQAPDPLSVAGEVKEAVWKVDSQLPITYLEPMSTVIAESLSERRFTMVLLTVFASLALTLAVIGIYGIASYHVTQRTQEIGIRMALGARPATVLGMMIRQGVLLCIAGVIIGTVGAFLLSRVAQGLLFQVNSTDPLSFTSSAVALVVVAALACYIPARRAAKIDPMRALRAE